MRRERREKERRRRGKEKKKKRHAALVLAKVETDIDKFAIKLRRIGSVVVANRRA